MYGIMKYDIDFYERFGAPLFRQTERVIYNECKDKGKGLLSLL